MSKLSDPSPVYYRVPTTREHVENFYNLVTADTWTFAVDTGGTIARAVPSGVSITTDTTDNDDGWIYTTSKVMPGTTNVKSAQFRGRIKQDVLTTTSWITGLASTFGSDMVADTAAVPAGGYVVALMLLEGETRLRAVVNENGTNTVNQVLDFAPTADTFFSFSIDLNVTMTSTPQVYASFGIDASGGSDISPVKAYGASERDAFYKTPNIYGAFPAAGLNFGTYLKQGNAAHVITWDWAAWSIRR